MFAGALQNFVLVYFGSVQHKTRQYYQFSYSFSYTLFIHPKSSEDQSFYRAGICSLSEKGGVSKIMIAIALRNEFFQNI